jgi:vacuolar protein sorting-associated protein 11
MDNDDSSEIVATCRKYGVDDPQLWIQALSYFSKSKRADACRNEIQQILECKSREERICILFLSDVVRYRQEQSSVAAAGYSNLEQQ